MSDTWDEVLKHFFTDKEMLCWMVDHRIKPTPDNLEKMREPFRIAVEETITKALDDSDFNDTILDSIGADREAELGELFHSEHQSSLAFNNSKSCYGCNKAILSFDDLQQVPLAEVYVELAWFDGGKLARPNSCINTNGLISFHKECWGRWDPHSIEPCAYILNPQPKGWKANGPPAKCGKDSKEKFGERWYCAPHLELLRLSDGIAAVQQKLSEGI